MCFLFFLLPFCFVVFFHHEPISSLVLFLKKRFSSVYFLSYFSRTPLPLHARWIKVNFRLHKHMTKLNERETERKNGEKKSKQTKWTKQQQQIVFRNILLMEKLVRWLLLAVRPHLEMEMEIQRRKKQIRKTEWRERKRGTGIHSGFYCIRSLMAIFGDCHSSLCWIVLIHFLFHFSPSTLARRAHVLSTLSVLIVFVA